jgi:hypothetical protein
MFKHRKNISLKITHKRSVNYFVKNLMECGLDFGPGTSVSIATDYGLDGLGIEFRWGRDFPRLSRPVLVPNQTPVQWVPVPSRG